MASISSPLTASSEANNIGFSSSSTDSSEANIIGISSSSTDSSEANIIGISSSSTDSSEANNKGNAFAGVLPQRLVASASSSMSYDVFINHRGRDVKQTLAADIYHKLDSNGLRSFLDQNVLEPGFSIPIEIEEAMLSAKLHVAILSPHYADSPWCLDELSFMLKTGTTIVPVFYDVEPAEIQCIGQDKGIYSEDFRKYEEKGRYTTEKLREWKTALCKVCSESFSGYKLKEKEENDKVLKGILDSALQIMGKIPLEVPLHRVGLDELAQEFERGILDSSHSDQDVQIVGIVGREGCGKTTLATELFHKKYPSFTRCSFIYNVKHYKNRLHSLQKKILEDLLPSQLVKDLKIDNEIDGMQIVADKLKSRTVLIGLDDIDDVNQIDALLPPKEMLGPGSLIIVTTQAVEVFKLKGIPFYNMIGLNPSHAKQLFCWYAFKQSDPMEGFEELVDKYVDVCDGLPLFLKSLGEPLYNRPKDYWMSRLDKASRTVQKVTLQQTQPGVRDPAP